MWEPIKERPPILLIQAHSQAKVLLGDLKFQLVRLGILPKALKRENKHVIQKRTRRNHCGLARLKWRFIQP